MRNAYCTAQSEHKKLSQLTRLKSLYRAFSNFSTKLYPNEIKENNETPNKNHCLLDGM